MSGSLAVAVREAAEGLRVVQAASFKSQDGVSARGCDAGCPVCGGVGYVRDPRRPGRVVMCPHNPRRTAALLRATGLRWEPPAWDVVTARDRAQQAAMAALERAAQAGGMVYLYGPPGRGKTFLARAFVWREALKGRSARYVTMAALLDGLRDAVSEGALREERERLAALEVLAIDEPEKAYAETPFAQAQVFEVLNARYEGGLYGGLVTVLTSNEPPERFGDYLVSRMRARGNWVVRMEGADLRRAK